MITSLDTAGYLKKLEEKNDRKTRPKKMLSHNGTNFIVGDREIRELVAQSDQEQIRRSSGNKGIDWHWNPATASHFGAVFKVTMKAAKRAICEYF